MYIRRRMTEKHAKLRSHSSHSEDRQKYLGNRLFLFIFSGIYGKNFYHKLKLNENSDQAVARSKSGTCFSRAYRSGRNIVAF